MDSTIVVAIIGAIATIVAAAIGKWSGKKRGYQKGFVDGRKHSIQGFMDIYEHDIHRAVRHLNKQEMSAAKNVARGLVENVKVWRDIQENLSKLLNGLITELEFALNYGDDRAVENLIRTINERYEGLRLALETVLQKSRI